MISCILLFAVYISVQKPSKKQQKLLIQSCMQKLCRKLLCRDPVLFAEAVQSSCRSCSMFCGCLSVSTVWIFYNCTCSVLFLWLDLHWMNDATILAQGTFIAFAFCLLHMFFFALVYVSRAFKICGMFQLQIFQFFTCVNQSRGSGFTLFFFFCGFLPGRAWGVMDRARIPQQSTATLFSWLLIILTELCRRFGVDLGTVVIECFEVNYPVPPAAVPAPCQSRCAICGSPCSRHSPAHLQHRCADHRRNQ